MIEALAIGWPQGIYLALTFVELGFALAQHGQPKDGKHSFWASLLASAIILPLLYWGGFFTG